MVWLHTCIYAYSKLHARLTSMCLRNLLGFVFGELKLPTCVLNVAPSFTEFRNRLS